MCRVIRIQLAVPQDRFLQLAERSSTWLTGPAFLSQPDHMVPCADCFDWVSPTKDTDIRPEVTVLSTATQNKYLDLERFQRFLQLEVTSLSCV